MKKAPYLQFARQADRWVSIREVPSGLACACRCPACGGRLLAKKGRRQQHHFAHYRGIDCAGALETALHQLAKDTIVEKRGLLVPPTVVYRSSVWRAAHWQIFREARVEVPYGGLLLDVLLQTGTPPALKTRQALLAVEVKVSHATDLQKQYRLVRQGIPAVEIDVRRIYQELLANDQAADLEALRNAILQHPAYRTWLFNPWQHGYEYRLAKTATERRVIISRQGQYQHYHVYRCPLRQRFVRAGFREGQAYARVFQDCLPCPHCREIVYQKEWVGFQLINTLPQMVRCGAAVPPPG
jgi:ssDNA-binding Zn-finger/Zn-ribbon topoisomerase 1